MVEVPPESRLAGYVGIVKDSERFRDFVRARPPAAAGGTRSAGEEVLPRRCPSPRLDDPTADQERLLEAVAKQWPGPLQMGLKVDAGAAARAAPLRRAPLLVDLDSGTAA